MPSSPRHRLEEAIDAVASTDLPDEFEQTFLTDLGEGRYARTVIHLVRGPDGEHRFGGAELKPPKGGLPLSELRSPDLPGLVREAKRQQIIRQVLDEARTDDAGRPDAELYTASYDSIDELWPMLDRKAAELSGRGPYKLTEEFLRGIRQQMNEAGRGGIGKVSKANDVSERTVRRWLAEAKERGIR